MFLITVNNLNIILVVYLVKKLIINNVAYTSKGSGVYVLWGWSIPPMGVRVELTKSWKLQWVLYQWHKGQPKKLTN